MEIILIVLAIIVIVSIVFYNGVVAKNNKVQESFSSIDVALQRRYDLIQNMAEVAKGYAKHEKETLAIIVEKRNINSALDANQYSDELNTVFSRLMVLKESYPELKANELFLNLQKAMVDCEEQLSASRRFYNSNVSLFNTAIQSFPSNLFANMLQFNSYEFFEKGSDIV